jgi:hypothetical protein
MSEAEPPHVREKDAYVRKVNDANHRWRSKAVALNTEYKQLLARPDGDQSPAALHSRYTHQREAELRIWQASVSAAVAEYRDCTGETAPPSVGWTPSVPEPLPAPGKALLGPPKKPRTKSSWFLAAGVLAVLLVVGASLSAMNEPSSKSSSSVAGSSSDSSSVEVLYEVEGTAKGANLTLEAVTGTVQQNDKAVPLVGKSTGKRGLTFTMPRGHFVYISAQNKGSSGTITCRITVDGVAISTNTSSGGYAIASCTGTAR